jgi:hypothetical protein
MADATMPAGITSAANPAPKSAPAGCLAGASSCATEEAKPKEVPLAVRRVSAQVVAASAAKQREAIPASQMSKAEGRFWELRVMSDLTSALA